MRSFAVPTALLLIVFLSTSCVVSSAVDSPKKAPYAESRVKKSVEPVDKISLNNLLAEKSLDSNLDLNVARRAVRDKPNAYEMLSECLEDSSRKVVWVNAVVLLSFVNDERVVPLLISFLLRDDSKLGPGFVPGEVYQAKATVPMAMALHLREFRENVPRSQRIKEFLKAHVRPSKAAWKQVTWQAEQYIGMQQNMLTDLSLSCIRAMGTAGGEDLTQYLAEWLPNHIERQRVSTDEGRNSKEIKRLGYPSNFIDKTFFDVFLNAVKESAIEAAKNSN